MKKYEVQYRISLDNDSFINYEVVEANNESEAFKMARDKGERRYMYESRCVASEPITHPDSKVVDITNRDTKKELNLILANFNL